MKKLKYIVVAILACFVLAPSSFATSEGQTRANGFVGIVSVNEVDKTDGIVINSDPTFDGLSMGFNVTLLDESDFIKYEAVIRNESDTDYVISEEDTFNPNDYLTYTYQVENPSLKAHSESKVHIAVEYTTEVPDAEFTGGVYENKNKAIIKLLNEDGSEANPNTYDATTSKYIAGIIVCAVVFFAFLLLFAKKRGRVKLGLFGLTIALGALPLLSFAAETIELTVNAEVSITRGYEAAYQFDFPFFDAYFKADDADLDMSQTTCDDVIYVGEISEANKYQHCSLPIKKDRSYAAGETVNVKVMSIDYLKVRYTNYCEEISDGVSLCQQDGVELRHDEVDMWGYKKINDGPYKTSEDDYDVMNFSNISFDGMAEGNLYLQLGMPCTFTMPTHPVLLQQVIMF